MKKTWHIARNELYSLFYSPIAWAMMLLFLLLTSADYIDVADYLLGAYKRGGPELHYVERLTIEHTIGINGFLSKVIQNLYLFLPLLTMGLISREINNDTIKILYSSPVKIRQIVLGKYIAMLVFTLCLMILLCLILTMVCLSVVNVDYGQILASVIGLYIILVTYAAIGIFISSLSPYQVAAAIVTLAIFMLLSRIGTLWQEVDVIGNIFFYMDIGKKSSNLTDGLFNLRDFTYCAIISCSFLAFTIIRLRSRRELISWKRKLVRYVVVIGLAFGLGYITSQPQINFYIDGTRDKLNTISAPTQAMLARLDDGELEITAYVNLLDNVYHYFSRSQQHKLESDLWEQYIRFKPDIKLKYVYYYNTDSSSHHIQANPGKTLEQIARNAAESHRAQFSNFLPPAQVSKLADIEAEENRTFLMLKYKNKTTVVRTFDDKDKLPGENEMAAGINRLIANPPKILFLTDEIERSPYTHRTRDYKKITSDRSDRFSLINQGYDFDTLSLKNHAAVPSEIAALAIADPRIEFSDENLQKINQYIDAGGNLYISSEPEKTEVIQPLLSKLGITLRPGRLIGTDDMYAADMVFGELTDTARYVTPEFAHRVEDREKYYGEKEFYVAFPGVSAMDYTEKDGFVIHPLVKTNPRKSWNRVVPIAKDSLQLKVGRLASDEEGSFVLGLRLNRNIKGKEQRIIVMSDGDYLNSQEAFGRTMRFNWFFGFSNFCYFSYGQFPANTRRAEAIDNKFRFLEAKSVPKLKLLFFWIIPALIGIGGSVILIRRRRK